MTGRGLLLWLCRLVAAAIIGWAGAGKFLGTEENVLVFTRLGMEPFGRFLIGGVEVAAALMLFREGFAAVGALLAIGTMCGAAIAHATRLGADVGGDGGLHLVLLAIVSVTAGVVLVAKRKTLPVIGETL